MKKIVYITTPGKIKMEFCNVLHEKSGNSVALVIVQHPKQKSFLKRLTSFFGKVPRIDFLSEIYYFFCMRWSDARKKAIHFSKQATPLSTGQKNYFPPSIHVDDINSDSVYKRIAEIAPDLIVVWGGSIIKKSIIAQAKKAINIHTGFCPYYRGTNCNFNAILNNDFEHIGITIHELTHLVDAGDIYTVITAETKNPPSVYFRNLNDQAVIAYLDTALRLLNGEILPKKNQDIALGKNYRLKDWTYKKQYLVSGKILDLENKTSSNV